MHINFHFVSLSSFMLFCIAFQFAIPLSWPNLFFILPLPSSILKLWSFCGNCQQPLTPTPRLNLIHFSDSLGGSGTTSHFNFDQQPELGGSILDSLMAISRGNTIIHNNNQRYHKLSVCIPTTGYIFNIGSVQGH